MILRNFTLSTPSSSAYLPSVLLWLAPLTTFGIMVYHLALMVYHLERAVRSRPGQAESVSASVPPGLSRREEEEGEVPMFRLVSYRSDRPAPTWRAGVASQQAFLTLEPGDLIATGTPSGIGARRQPPLFLRAGDIVEVEIEPIGMIRNQMVAEAHSQTR
jgi:hypothetical protein